MTTIATKKETTKRALVQLRVVGINGVFPSGVNLEKAIQQRASALGYQGIGTVTVDAASTDAVKLVNIAATDIEAVRLVGILDDVLKTFIGGGYTIELVQVAGTTTAEFKFTRITKKQLKLNRAAAADKITSKPADATKAAKPDVTKDAKVTVTKDVKPVATVAKSTKGRFFGRRASASRKLAREYVKRDLTVAGAQPREYVASGAVGVSAEVEAAMIARFLFAEYSISAVAEGAKLKVTVLAEDDVAVIDQLVSSVSVRWVLGEHTSDNNTAVEEWITANAGMYVDSNDAAGYFIIGPKDNETAVPTLT